MTAFPLALCPTRSHLRAIVPVLRITSSRSASQIRLLASFRGIVQVSSVQSQQAAHCSRFEATSQQGLCAQMSGLAPGKGE